MRSLLAFTLALALGCSTAPTPAPADAALDRASDVTLSVDVAPDAARPDVAPDVTSDVAADVAQEAAADAAADIADAAADAPREAAVDAPAMDVAAGDAGVTMGSDAILGTLRGTCGTLRGMLRSPSPSLLRNELVFVAPERYARDQLSPHGQRIFDTPNAGGSSIESEVMAMEVLHYCEGASILRTETEIRYQPPDDAGANSITDILVTVDGQRVGVSVTRAYIPSPMMLTDANVRSLLTSKLQGINRSSQRVLPEDRWVKQVLHVLAASPAYGDVVERVWGTLDATLRADTVVIVTSTRGGGFIYCNPDPALGMECPPLM